MPDFVQSRSHAGSTKRRTRAGSPLDTSRVGKVSREAISATLIYRRASTASTTKAIIATI